MHLCLPFRCVLATVCGALFAFNPYNLAANDPTKPIDYEWVKITMNAAFAPRDGAGTLSV